LKEKLIGSDREGLELGLGLGIIDRRSEPDRRSQPNTVLKNNGKYYEIHAIGSDRASL